MVTLVKQLSGVFRGYPLGSGFAYLWESSYRVQSDELDHDALLEVDVENGRLVITSLALERRPEGPPVTMDALKSLPLVGLIAQSLTEGPTTGLARELGPNQYALADWESVDDLPELERVAVVYRAAYFEGANPTKEVADFLGVSRDVAAKRVQAARRAGLLEPTTKGKKGA